jgi:hypothetical protein
LINGVTALSIRKMASAASAMRCASVDRMVTLNVCRTLNDIPQLGLATESHQAEKQSVRFLGSSHFAVARRAY